MRRREKAASAEVRMRRREKAAFAIGRRDHCDDDALALLSTVARVVCKSWLRAAATLLSCDLLLVDGSAAADGMSTEVDLWAAAGASAASFAAALRAAILRAAMERSRSDIGLACSVLACRGVGC